MSLPRPSGPPRRLARFSPAERWVHRSTAALLGVCLLTAAVLYVGPLSTLIGRRLLVERVHIIAGLGLPVPLVLGLVSRALRADLGHLNRWTRSDWQWLRSPERRSGRIRVGKFNAGQKLNAAFTAGAVLVLLGSGLMLAFPQPWPVLLRGGATFVHDWFAAAVLVVAIGHIWYAVRDPVARAGLRTGQVPEWWARRDHEAWAEAQLGGSADPPPPAG